MTLLIIGLVAIAALLAIPLWLRPKALITTTLLATIFVRTLEHLTGSSQVSNLDDALVLLSVVRALTEVAAAKRVRGFPGISAFSIFALAGITSALASPYFDASIAAAGSFLALKGIALGWVASQFVWRPEDIHAAVRQAGVVITLVLLFCIPNLIAPGPWASLFTPQGTPIQRFGLPSLQGPFIHPFDLAYFCGMSAIGIYAFRQTFPKSRYSFFLLIGTTLGTVLSFRRKDLLGLIAGFIVTGSVARRTKLILALALVLPLVAFALWDEISGEIDQLLTYLDVASGEARTLLTVGAGHVAITRFPFGAGFGYFGSRTAAVNYSPEYVQLGFPGRYGLGPGNQGFFLTDTAWPAIFGETGFIGGVAFGAGLVAIAMAARKWSKSTEPALAFFGYATVGWVILTAFQSTGAAVFTSPPGFATLFTIAGIGASLYRNADRATVEVPGTQRPTRRIR